MKQVVIINTGVANIASVLAAFDRAGVHARLTSDADEVMTASHAVLPGVGTFQAGMTQLTASGIDAALKARIAEQRPVLAVCLGLQLLFSSSEESPGIRGLEILTGTIRRFKLAAKIPQLGWNLVTPETNCVLLKNGFAYFANSFCYQGDLAGYSIATAKYEETFVAAFEKGSLLACQFHPELSGPWGQDLINRWLAL